MKRNSYLAVFVICLIHIESINSKSSEATNIDDNYFDLDSQELILEMKSIVDNYADKLKSSVKGLDKILFPTNEGPKQIYTSNFTLEDFNRQVKEFINNITEIRRQDLNTYNDDKHKEEKKKNDFMRQNKILTSKMITAEKNKRKIISDLKEKVKIKSLIEAAVNSSTIEIEKLVNARNNELTQLKLSTDNYINTLNKLNLNYSIYEDETVLKDQLEILKSENFKNDFEYYFYKNLNSTENNFMINCLSLKKLFEEELNKLKEKTDIIKLNIKYISDTANQIQKDIENKFSVYQKLNETLKNLNSIHQEYKKALNNSEDNANNLKSKKKLIQEKISVKLKNKKMMKNKIESVLNNLEKEIDNYDIDKFKVNKVRKEITNVNFRIRDLLTKENMIIKQNKIKI